MKRRNVLGEKRRCEKDRGFACASAATLGRLELGTQFSDRYRKIHADPEQMEDALLTAGVRCLAKSQQVFVLDVDATDNPLQMLPGLVGSFLQHELHLHSPVLTAETAEDGIRQFRAHHPDLVITELNLAGPTGAAMIARIREDDFSSQHSHSHRSNQPSNPPPEPELSLVDSFTKRIPSRHFSDPSRWPSAEDRRSDIIDEPRVCRFARTARDPRLRMNITPGTRSR